MSFEQNSPADSVRGFGFADIHQAKIAAENCKSCPLWKHATQTVFGEGPVPAQLMLVGEQPGHHEDVSGRPFVGPAGKLLDSALDKAGVDRASVYVTNAVKHFKWEPLGKRRLHKRPSAREIEACRPWLLSELELVKPRLVICMGATAVTSLLGKEVRITANRGKFLESNFAPAILVTVHPSAILRAQDDKTRSSEFERFVEDLREAASFLRA
jgi:uracil-DNA glycosylase